MRGSIYNTQEHFPTLCVGKLISTYITMGITLESSKIRISIVIALSIFHLLVLFDFLFVLIKLLFMIGIFILLAFFNIYTKKCLIFKQMTRITHTHYTFDIIFLRTNVDTNFEITPFIYERWHFNIFTYAPSFYQSSNTIFMSEITI